MRRSGNHYYLNKADGKVFGVCAGFADYLGVDALWIRIAVVAMTLLGMGIIIPIYFLIAFLATTGPSRIDYDGMDDETYLDRLRRGRDRSSRIRTDISDMDRRLAEMERSYGTDSRLSNEIDSLR